MSREVATELDDAWRAAIETSAFIGGRVGGAVRDRVGLLLRDRARDRRGQRHRRPGAHPPRARHRTRRRGGGAGEHLHRHGGGGGPGGRNAPLRRRGPRNAAGDRGDARGSHHPRDGGARDRGALRQHAADGRDRAARAHARARADRGRRPSAWRNVGRRTRRLVRRRRVLQLLSREEPRGVRRRRGRGHRRHAAGRDRALDGGSRPRSRVQARPSHRRAEQPARRTAGGCAHDQARAAGGVERAPQSGHGVLRPLPRSGTHRHHRAGSPRSRACIT